MIDVPIETGAPILADEIITALDALLLSGEDFDVWLEQTGNGLALMISTIEGTFTLCIYQSGAWQPSTDGGDTDSDAIETPAFLCPRSFRYGAPSPSSLVQVPNDAKEGFEDELIDLHYTWLQLVGTFVATGWRVVIEYLPPKSLEDFGSVNVQAKGPLSERTHHRVIQGALGRVPETVIAVAKWCESGPDSWDFDTQSTGLAADYEIWPRSAVHLEDYAIAVAPLWTLAPGIDQPLDHFPDTGAVRPTVDLSPPPRPGQEELERRQEQIREWAMDHEFLREVRPAKAKAVRELLGKEGSEPPAITYSSSRPANVMSGSQPVSTNDWRSTSSSTRTSSASVSRPTLRHLLPQTRCDISYGKNVP